MSAHGTFVVTPQTKVHRRPARASYDRAVAYAILDEALVATVAFDDGGQPFALPMAFARLGDRLVLHAASSGRFARVLASGAAICATVTLVDAVVLARSAMHHSMNYRSVIVLGATLELVDEAEKLAALRRLIDHVVPGRSSACRPPNTVELKATRVFALPLEAVSVKQRLGGPLEDADDLELPYWAGVVPLALRANEPIADTEHTPRGPEPALVRAYDRAALVREVAP